MDWSLSKVIRIEMGAVGISTNDLRALLRLYEIEDEDRINGLIELAKLSRQASWWSKYREDITPQYLQYIEYEEAASVLRFYEPLLIPGILQSEDYVTEIIRELADPGTAAERIRARIEIRLKRQQLLEQNPSPTLICVIDEAAIQRLLGQRSIARGQIVHLIELAERPNITVEIVPFSAGFHRGLLEMFTILEFPDPEDADVLFSETSRDTILSQDEAGEITGYREVFEQLRSISLGPDKTLSYLTNILKQSP